MNFGELLKQYINDSETSVRLFSKITDLNRGWLYNIFSGKKKLPEDKFHNMLNQFPFSTIQKKLLRDAYYEEIYGVDNHTKIQFIISELKALTLQNDLELFFPDKTQKFTKNLTYLSTAEQLNNSIITLLSALSSNEKTPAIYCNFSFEQKNIDDLIYSFLLQHLNMSFFHIVNFDNIGSDIHNLRNIFRSIKYAQNKFNTFYYYDNNHPFQLDNLFPFFIVTNKGAILYNKLLNNGLLILETSIVNELIKKAKSILSQCMPLVLFPDSIFQIQQHLAQNIEQPFEISIGVDPCPTKYLTLDILEDIAKDSVPDKNYFVHRYYEWIKLTETDSQSFLYLNSLEGFINFAQNGYLKSFPEKYANPLPVRDRIHILQKCLESSEKSFYLVDNSKIFLPENIHIKLHPPYTNLIYGSFDTSDFPYLGEFIILLCNNTILSDFVNFKDYLIRNKFYLDDKYTQLFFNDLILKLKT